MCEKNNLTKEELQKVMLKEIDLTQDIIKRMANNSFLIKGWTITLVVGTFLFKSEKMYYGGLIALLPLFGFWALDAFFLRTEKKYRKLYNWIIKNRMSSQDLLYDLNPQRFENDVEKLNKIAWSDTLRWFYGSVFLTIILITGVSWFLDN